MQMQKKQTFYVCVEVEIEEGPTDHLEGINFLCLVHLLQFCTNE